MNPWLYVRGGLVVVSFLDGAIAASRLDIALDQDFHEIAAAVFVFGIVAMLLIVGVQALASRSDAEWTYPSWRLNPFKLGQPLQFFHLGGYFFLAEGAGVLLRSLFVEAMPLGEPVVLTACGIGMLTGVWCCTRLFKRKMAPKT